MTRVGYRIDGPPGAPLLVLANSLGTTWRMWDPQVPALTARFRVLRYDHPGHGASPDAAAAGTMESLAMALLDLLDHLGEARASMCGLSLGGMVAMWIAIHAPSRVERLVLADTSAHLPPPHLWAERAALVRSSGTSAVYQGLLDRWFTRDFLDRRPDVAAMVAEMLALAVPQGYATCCEAIGGMDQTGDLGRITAPTLVITGAEDPVTPPATAFAIHERIPGSSLVILPGCAHLANIEQSDRFNAALVDHLADLDVERGRTLRRQVLGDAYVDRASATPNLALQDLITRYAWGEIWTRPGLDMATRSCITMAMLVALGRNDELALHIRGARRNGLTDQQISEVLLHAAIYCGVPAAISAFRVLDDCR